MSLYPPPTNSLKKATIEFVWPVSTNSMRYLKKHMMANDAPALQMIKKMGRLSITNLARIGG
jgi:hypothetical protein